MKILVVGSGGREHALAWKISQSPKVSRIYAAPGNPGMANICQCVNISVEDIEGLLQFAQQEKIDLTVVGPEVPLVLGITDCFNAHGLQVFGPKQKCAELEGSKIFMKDLLKKYCLPTADYAVFTDKEEALAYLAQKTAPIVVKADGLAAGKGVIVATTMEEAQNAVIDMLEKKVFGTAGEKVVIEDCLEGEEVSLLAFTDGKTVVPMVPAQDHKRAYDNDQGPNTGGMGAYSPVPHLAQDLLTQIAEEIIDPTIKALASEGREYKGVIYAGIMLTKDGPSILEFNARFGDPETQVLMARLETDLVDIMQAVVEGTLDKIAVEWKADSAVCVVLASGGYPGSYHKGEVIKGLEKTEQLENTVVFHAGTKQNDENIVTAGGRVLGVTALGEDIEQAIKNAYLCVEKISFSGMQYRKDIGHNALHK